MLSALRRFPENFAEVIADLSTVWLMLELFPSDAAAVRFGQQVEAEIQSIPGEIYTGRVAFVDPLVDPLTRTVAVRVEMSNFDRQLKPGDYAAATIRVPAIARDEVYDPALAGKWISPMHPEIVKDGPGSCDVCGKVHTFNKRVDDLDLLQARFWSQYGAVVANTNIGCFCVARKKATNQRELIHCCWLEPRLRAGISRQHRDMR